MKNFKMNVSRLLWPDYLQPFNRQRLYISDQCELSCLGCNLRPNTLTTDKLSLLLNRPSEWRLVARQLDIIGGDPLANSKTIAYVLRHRPRASKVNLWSHGTDDWTPIAPLLRHIDHIFLFVPRLAYDAYREFTGRDRRARVDDTVQFLREHSVGVTIVQLATEDTVSGLPDDYDWIASQKLEWLLIYNASELASPLLLEYLWRFNGISGCYVLPKRLANQTVCLGYPF